MRVACFVCSLNFSRISENHAFTLCVHTGTSHVVQTKHNVLRRNNDWLTTRRSEDVVGGHHQSTRFELRFQRQRNMHRHLISVKVSVVCRADQRVQLNGLAFNKHRLECLNTQTVKCRCAVQQHWVLANDISKNIPDFRRFALNHFLGSFYGRGKPAALQLSEDERLEQFQCHFLGQTALMKLERRANHNN